MANNTASGRFFEDFTPGETIIHATARTLGEGDMAWVHALYGNRHALTSSAPFATALGYAARPLDDVLVFNVIFGKTVPDISYNAVANLGYAEGVFAAPVFCGDTLSARSEVLGVRENSNGTSGIVMVRTQGFNQHGVCVLHYVRWVMVRKRTPAPPATGDISADKSALPELAPYVSPDKLVPPPADFARSDCRASGSARGFDDYQIGDKIDHNGGLTLTEAEHRLATRLYQNTARVHFDDRHQADTDFGKCLIYGGHIIAHMRAMSFNGLENAFVLAGLNAGTHAAPCFAGDTIYGWSEILDKATFVTRRDIGAIRVRHIATKNHPTDDFPLMDDAQRRHPAIILDMDCWYWLPRLK